MTMVYLSLVIFINLAILDALRILDIIVQKNLKCNIPGQVDCSNAANIQCQQNYFLFDNYIANGNSTPQQYCVKCPYQDYNDPLTLYCMDCVENPYTWNMNRQCTYDYQILSGVAVDGVYKRVDRSSSELYFVDLSMDSTLQNIPVTYLCEGCEYFCYNTTEFVVSSPCSLIISSHESYDPGHNTVSCLPGYYANSGICQNCVQNCQKCDQTGCLQVSQGYYSSITVSGTVITQCSTTITNCISCQYNQTSLVLQCLSCLKDSSGNQWITSLNLQSCELCESNCQRCEYTTYNTSILQSNVAFFIYPTRYSYTNDFINQNALSYIKKCRQCSIKDYIFSANGIQCVQCSVQYCAKCIFSYQTNIGGIITIHTTADLDYIPTTSYLNQLCYQCIRGYSLTSDFSSCNLVASINLIQYCSTYEYTDIANTILICVQCDNTYFYNLNTQECQIHDPNQQILTGYTLQSPGQYVLSSQSATTITNLVNSLSNITCSTYLSHCSECYLYKSLDENQPTNQITSAYIYQCASCDTGYYADFFSGLCLLCKTQDQIQSCSDCSQYSFTYNYTDYVYQYPSINSSAKSHLQYIEPLLVKPMCFNCISGYTFLTSINDCDACGSNCYTDSCQTTSQETYCKKCWPLAANYTSRSLSVDDNQCINCPNNCEACRVRTLQEKNSVNPDFNTTYSALSKYSLYCYKPAYGSFYDTFLGMPVSCSSTNGCFNSVTIDIQLYCSIADYIQYLNSGIQTRVDPSLVYNLQSFYSSSFGTPSISFDLIDNSDTYTSSNAIVLQEMFLNIHLVAPSDKSQLCSIPSETNLKIQFSKNIFSLKNLVVTLQGSSYSNSPNYDQSLNTIVSISKYLNLLYLRNIVINGLTFIYPLTCSQALCDQMMSNNIPIVWGLSIQQNGLTKLKLQSCTFGANASYLQQMNTSETFSTNDKLLFQFKMNNIYDLSMINVTMNYNNFTYNQNTNPLTRTYDVPQLTQKSTFIDGLLIIGLGLYGTPLFEANDVFTISQQIQIGPNGLTLKFCNFYNGGDIFGESTNSSTSTGQIDVDRMVLQYCSFQRSSIFSLKSNINNGTLISNVDIIGCNFMDSSYAFFMNNIQLINIYTYMLTLSSSSFIIKTNSGIPDDPMILENSLNLQLYKIHFSNIACETSGCLISLTSPSNTMNLRSNLTINGMTIENTNIMGIVPSILQSVSSALIQLNNIDTIVIGNLKSDNNLAIVIIYIDSIAGVRFYDCLFDSSQFISNSSQQQQNNLMPVTIDCLKTKSDSRQFNYIQIYVTQFLYGVYMQNVTLQNLLALDNTLIHIQSYDALLVDTAYVHSPFASQNISNSLHQTSGENFLADDSCEIIEFIGCKYINNRLVASKSNSISSIIYTTSEQNQIIALINCLFQLNHLHSLVQLQNVPLASCMTINSINSNVAIFSSNFSDNAATQTQYGLIYILARKALISKTVFTNTSVYDKSWNQRLQKNNMKRSQFQQFFGVIAKGGNAYINSEHITIQFCTFNVSQAGLGAGLYLYTLSDGIVVVQYSTFQNLSSSLDAKQFSQGGALYIDSSNSKLNLVITNVEMQRCQARKSGGCIYISTSAQAQTISINQSKFVNCYALTSSFMEVVFPQLTSQIPSVELDDINVSQELSLLQIFYYSVPELKVEELNSLISKNSIYYQNYGKFKLNNSNFANIFYTSALNLQFMTQIDLQEVSITYSTLFWLPLIVLHLSENSAAKIAISRLEFSNNDIFSSHSNVSICKTKQIKQVITSPIDCKQTTRLLQGKSMQSQGPPPSTQSGNPQNQQSSSSSSSSLSLNPSPNKQSKTTQNKVNTKDCSNTVTLYSEKYNDIFGQYFGQLTQIQRYGSLQMIQDKLWSEEDLVSFEDNVSNYGTDFAQATFSQQNYDASSFMDCQLNSLLPSIQSSAPTAFIRLDTISNVQTLTISEINLLNNNCSRCFGGLIQIIGIDDTPTRTPIIQMIDATCQDNSIGYYGCFTFSSANSLDSIDDSFHRQNNSDTVQRVLSNDQQFEQQLRTLIYSQNDSTLIGLQSLNRTIDIQQSNFQANNATIGAGISVFGLSISIFDTDFIDNYASHTGAGLFFYNTLPLIIKETLYLYDVTFEGNVAKVGGGIMLVNASIGNTTQWKVIFSNNKATSYAQNMAEYPQQLSIQIMQGNTMPIATFMDYSGNRSELGNIYNSTIKIIDYVNIPKYSLLGFPKAVNNLILPSGQKISSYLHYYAATQEQVPYNYVFRIINLDRFQQQVSSIDSSQSCTVSGRRQSMNHYDDLKPFLPNYTTTNVFRYSVEKGAFDLDEMVILFDPKLPSTEYLQLRFSCTSVQIPVYSNEPPYNIIDYNKNYFLYVNVSTFPCQLGEYYKLVANSDNGTCLSCGADSNTYSVDANSIACQSINKSSMVGVNPYMINAKPGYWRPYDNTSIVSYCENYDANCLGGWSIGINSCYEGHDGALCESCDLSGRLNGETWAQSAPYKCGKCSELLTQNTSIIIGISILTLLSIIASVVGNYEIVEQFIRNQLLVSMGALVRDEDSGLAVLVKIFTNYFQIISAVATFQLSFPSAFQDSVSNIGNPVKSMSVSYDCFFITITNIEVLYFRIIWALLMPFFYLCLFLLGYMIAVISKKAPYKISIIYTTFIYMFIYLQPNLIGGFMSLASQRQISGYAWVQADVRYRFDSPQHQSWVAAFVAPNLVLWACLLPFGLLINLIFSRDTLSSNHTKERWGYFYNEYRQEAYFWEFIKIFQKELIIIFLMYFQDQIIVKGLLIFFMIFSYGGVALFLRPYQSKLLNFLDIESTMICATSMSGGVLSYAASQQQLDGLAILILVIVAVINILFIFQMIAILFHGYFEKFDDKIDTVRLKIIAKRPNLVIEYPWLRKLMIIRKDMKIRINYLWGQLRYETKLGIKRKRLDPNAILIECKPMKVQETNKSQSKKNSTDEKQLLIEAGQQNSEQTPELESEKILSGESRFEKMTVINNIMSPITMPRSNKAKIYPYNEEEKNDASAIYDFNQ